MAKMHMITLIATVLFFGAMVALVVVGGPGSQLMGSQIKHTVILAGDEGYPESSDGLTSIGPTSKNCFSERYHASTDCDRIASQEYFSGPSWYNCFSERYHASTDCDRIASEEYFSSIAAAP